MSERRAEIEQMIAKIDEAIAGQELGRGLLSAAHIDKAIGVLKGQKRELLAELEAEKGVEPVLERVVGRISHTDFVFELTPYEPFTEDSYREFLHNMGKMEGLLQYGGTALSRRANRPSDFLWIEVPKVYRTKLPLYLLARCPFCGGEVRERVDTFSLLGPGWWLSEAAGYGWYGRQKKSAAWVWRVG
ncbi:MAG TPA: hypothetical protein VLL52_20420, partial [Anaerolineae bacterium]|nr:hypothetical protein [Anaerolineae bacterium]